MVVRVVYWLDLRDWDIHSEFESCNRQWYRLVVHGSSGIDIQPCIYGHQKQITSNRLQGDQR